MRILHVISSMNPAHGGTSEAVRQLALEGRRTGHEVLVATIDDPSAAWLRDYPLPVAALGPGRGGFQYSGRFQQWLRENVGVWDVVISHGLWQFTGPAVRTACGRKPYFVFPHGMLDPWFNQFLLKRVRKMVYWPWGEYRVLCDARAVIFTSEEEKLGARRSFSPYQASEMVVPLGIEDPPAWSEAMEQAFRAAVPGLDGRRFLLFFGRIHPKKGCDLLIQAFAALVGKHPDVDLVMAGPDQTGWTAGLQKMALDLGVAGRIFWPGMLSGDAKWGALALAEAFVLPSHQENFGLAVAESLASGTPVLISDRVNIWREIVESGGGFSGPDTLEGTVRLLRGWLDGSAVVTRGEARACFAQRFRLAGAAQCLYTRLEELLS